MKDALIDGSFDRLIVVVLASSTKKRRDRIKVGWVTQINCLPASLVIHHPAQDGKAGRAWSAFEGLFIVVRLLWCTAGSPGSFPFHLPCM